MKEDMLLIKENVRADSYKFLSQCYYLPDEKFLQKLNSLKEANEGICFQLAKSIPDSNAVEVLSIDFARLFIGPFTLLAPPYGSVYLDNSKTLMNDSTIDARNCYEREGLDVRLKEAPDHAAIELEFMYFLIFKEMESINNSNTETNHRFLEKQDYFLKKHLGKWVAPFTERIEEFAQTEFYRNLARITRLFVAEDFQNLSERLIAAS